MKPHILNSKKKKAQVSLGQSRVMVKYSDSEEQQKKICCIRAFGAEMIDFINYDKSKKDVDGEQARVYAHAMTVIEDAVMWSIKAICK